MINQNLLDRLDYLGFGADIDALESHVALLQDAAGMGAPLVTDTQYDMFFGLLRELKPDSPILNRNWEAEDNELDTNDEILTSFKMMSIRTIQDWSELYKFKDALGSKKVDLFASLKMNGHAIRAVYRYGELVGGSTRGRYKKGREILKHLKAVLPNTVEEWKSERLVEVRGEMLVSLKNFEQVKYSLKTALSAVTSFIRESVTDEELSLLSCVCYKIIPSIDSKLEFNSLYDQFSMLMDCGFRVPPYSRYEEITADNVEEKMEQCLEDFSVMADEGLEFLADGIVVAIDDKETFNSMGTDGNTYLGNFALKMGRHWECNLYSSTIKYVDWTPGKKYFTPKAIVEPVTTMTGAEVSTVPLYNVGVMDKLGLVPGALIYFKFGGETGVTLVKPDGSPVSE